MSVWLAGTRGIRAACRSIAAVLAVAVVAGQTSVAPELRITFPREDDRSSAAPPVSSR